MKLHQSGNKIIITELNPMSDAPLDQDVLLFKRDNTFAFAAKKIVHEDGYESFYDSNFGVFFGSGYFIGWLPMPVYEPEDK